MLNMSGLKTLLRLGIPLATVFWALASPAQTPALLDVDTRRIVNENAVGDATRLFDEQNKIGGVNVPTNVWTTPWSSWYYPLSAVIDLAGNCQLTDLVFFDSSGTGTLKVQALVTNSWVDLFTDGQARYQTWVTNHVSARARYVRVIAYTQNVIPPEMALYGWRLEPAQAYPRPAAQTPPAFDQFMGVNTVVTDPIGRVEAFGCAREYHDWNWDEGGSAAYPNDTNKWFISYSGNWNFDLYYRNLSLAGVTVAPCKQGSVNWLGVADEQYKPIPTNTVRDAQQPASYIEHADHLYQFAARCGMTTVSNANLKLASSEPRLSGLGLVRYIENWNEPDKTWKNREGYFLPYEYAAMSSADADGHLGALGPTTGIKNADPQAKLVMAGLITFNLDYLKAMKFWCEQNRGGSFPWDAINFHYYCSDAGGQGGATPTVGVSPEVAGFRAQAAALVDYRNRFLPGKEVWVSEFGYDVNPASPQRAPAIGATPAEEVQGRWIIRSFLALAAAGVDRALLFMLSDPSSTDPTQFSTSGVIQDAAHQYAVRRAWFYCRTLKERLRGLRYLTDQTSGNTNVTIYQFADTNGTVKALAVWCPTRNNVTVPGYTLALPGNPASATLVTLANDFPLGVTNALAISGRNVTIDVSENPVLVLAGVLPNAHWPDGVLPLNANMVTNESNLGNAGCLADEAAAMGDPNTGTGGSPTNIWFPSWNASDYPASAYLDFGQFQPVSKVFLYDSNGVGNVTVSTGFPGHWQPVFQDDLRNYGTWNAHLVNLRTRYLRVTRADTGGNIAEIAVYTNAWVNQLLR